VARQAKKGDLVLFYRSSPDSYLSDVFVLVGDAKHQKAGWKAGKDWMANISRVASLRTPLHWEEMKRHHILRSTPFVRRNMQGRHRATEFWPVIRDLILRRNPTLKLSMRPYGAERISLG
jgi:hypothetical protein